MVQVRLIFCYRYYHYSHRYCCVLSILFAFSKSNFEIQWSWCQWATSFVSVSVGRQSNDQSSSSSFNALCKSDFEYLQIWFPTAFHILFLDGVLGTHRRIKSLAIFMHWLSISGHDDDVGAFTFALAVTVPSAFAHMYWIKQQASRRIRSSQRFFPTCP